MHTVIIVAFAHVRPSECAPHCCTHDDRDSQADIGSSPSAAISSWGWSYCEMRPGLLWGCEPLAFKALADSCITRIRHGVIPLRIHATGRRAYAPSVFLHPRIRGQPLRAFSNLGHPCDTSICSKSRMQILAPLPMELTKTGRIDTPRQLASWGHPTRRCGDKGDRRRQRDLDLSAPQSGNL